MGTSYQLPHEAEELDDCYTATEEEWKGFMASKGWQDLKIYIQEAIETGKELLALEASERGLPESDDSLRGGIKIARKILSFPEEQLREIIERSDQKVN